MYAGNTLTIASSSGNITRVVFTPTSETYDATNLSYDDEDLTSDDWTLPSASASVTLTAGAAARFESIKVYSGSSTYTVTIARNNTSYGTVSTSSVGSLSSGAAITKGTGANINKITIGGTTVTATPAATDADYTYAFSSWTVPGDVTTVTADITITANFTRTARPLTNYRTVCCTELGTIDGEASLTQGGNSVTISGWSDVSNVGTYTVKLYKKNGASWDLVSGTTSGGSAGAQGTRTGITSGSKSVTYTGLEVESEYKFTVQAIAGSAAYCDGVETAVTEINDVDVSSTPFKFRYSIYIDNGSNSGWAHHYIEPTGNTDEGSIDITLAGPVDYYQFKIGGGFSGWWGQTGESKYTTGGTQWTLDGSQNVKMQTWIGGTYTFTVDYSGTTNPKVTITYPSANQDAGNIVYWDASVVANWDHLHFRVGTDGNANAGSDCKTDLQKVPGTDNFYKVTTASFTGMRVWAIANNTGWTGSNTNGVYKTNTGDGYAVTLSSDYQDYVVGEDGVTLVPYGSGAMGSYSHDNNCRFYTVTKTDGMLTHNVSLNSPAHGTLLVTYTNTSGTTGQTVTEGNNADLAHRCILTITATPDDGYTCTSLTVNSSNFTSGNTHILSADAIVEATFTAKSCTVNFDKNSGTGGDASTTATYGSAMTTVTAPTRTGYTFDGYWDAETDNDGSGTQYYLANGTSARNWDKDVTAAQTLYAKWIAKSCTVTFDKNGGSGGDNNVTATYDATMTTITPPTRSGYTFDGYWDEETDNDGSGNKYYNANGTSAATWNKNTTSETTLYAKWIAKTDTYMTAMHEGASGWTAYASGHEESGAGYTIPNPGDVAKAGTGCEGIHYHFAGWVTEANKEAGTISGNIIPASGTTDATGTTFWAVWEKESDESSPVTYTKVTTISEGTYLMATMTNAQYVHQTTFAYAGKKLNDAVSPEYIWGDTIPVNISTNVISSKPANAKEITVTLGTGVNEGYFSMYDGDKYITMTTKGKFTFADDISYEWELNGNAYIHNKGTYDKVATWMIILNNGNSGSPSAYFVPMKDKDEGYNSGSYYYHAFLFKKAGGIVYDDPKVECICSVNPSAGTAAVDAEGTFSASSIAVKATSASTGHADCSYTDYGFVWSSSVTTPTLVEGTGAASDNCTKEQVGTDGQVTTFAGSISGSFTANNPIYVRSYVKNGKSDGTYQYSDVVTITPRSVTFNLNGHGSSAPVSQFVNNGSKATDPSYSESVTGYIFGGWYKEEGCSNAWNFATDVVSGESKTLYAKWTPISYSVRFNNNDENYLGTATGEMSNESFDYDEEKALTTNTFSLAGYDFAGWALTADEDVAYTDGASASNLSSTDGATVDLYAIWSPKNYDVTLAATDETSSVGSQTVTATYNAAMPTTKKGSGDVVAPSRTGYTFTGWEYSSTTYYNYNAGTSTLSSAHVWDQPNSTTTLTPKWSINSYTLTWNLGGGTVATAGTGAEAGATGTPSSSVVYNSAITVPTVTKAGYDFAGWDVTPASNMPASDVTYTATWTAKTLNSISLAEASVSVYVGEIKYVNVIFDPTDILSKAFGQVATPSYCQLNSYDSYNKLKITGGRAGADISVNRTETVSIKYTADETKTASISVTVKPLPTVTFVDLIHNKSDFANSGDGWTAGTGVLSSTETTGVVSHAKKTPTHTDVTAPVGGNACETGHLHLMGWIRSDYSKVADYMNGTGEAPSVSDLTTAGAEYWFLPDADINTETYNGKTFYAVWAVEE